MVIRSCVAGDLERVVELQKQWQKDEAPYGFVPDSMKSLRSRLGEYFLVAEEKGRIIGFACGSEHANRDFCIFPINSKYLEIVDIFIARRFRSRKTGSRLMNRLIRTAKSRGIRRFLVYSSMKDLSRVMGFYKKHKFKTWAIQMFRADGDGRKVK